MSADLHLAAGGQVRVAIDQMGAFCTAVLKGAGANEETATAATRAMMHGSIHGIDSHGVRLLDHYVRAFRGGRITGTPKMQFIRQQGAVATLDAGHAHGALATYTAMDKAADIARRVGLSGIAIQNTSHFGPAGAYVMKPAADGLIGIVLCNSDSFVRLHGGAMPFHGTNPLAVAAPSGQQNPWLFDMATSAIPYNRMLLHRSLQTPLPDEVASLDDGHNTNDPDAAKMLAPLGAAYGYKGAGLAGLVEIFSAVLTGMKLSAEILPMDGQDMATPRQMGAFILAIDPDFFIGRDVFQEAMRRYLNALRSSQTAPGQRVMAPGDREWAEADTRRQRGIPIDPTSAKTFRALSETFGVRPPPMERIDEQHQT